jgi:4-amino-4-deoxy-L-arabinose transferase-like glycosyltransferase
MALEFFQTVVSALSCVVLYLIGKRLYSPQTGLLAALMLAVYPSSIHFAVQKIWSTTFFAACALLLFLILERASQRPGLRVGIGLGVCFGLVALLDPVILAVVPFALGWLMWQSEDPRARSRVLIAALAGLVLALSPWLIRNYAVFDRLVPVKSNFGNELFVGNNPISVGNHRDVRQTRKHLDELLTPAEWARYTRSHEVERNALLGRKALQYIVEDPSRFLGLSTSRFLHYWTRPTPLHGWILWVAELCWFALLGLGILGIATCNLGQSRVQLVILFLIALPLPFYITLVSHFRYRYPIEPLLMLPAAHSLLLLCRAWRGRGLANVSS